MSAWGFWKSIGGAEVNVDTGVTHLIMKRTHRKNKKRVQYKGVPFVCDWKSDMKLLGIGHFISPEK